MITFLIRAAVFVISAALGILVATALVPGFSVFAGGAWGFVLAIVIFAVVQSIVAPVATRVAKKRAPLLLGGVGILATFVSLLIVTAIPGTGMAMTQFGAWFLAPLIVWVVSALATWGLSALLLKPDPGIRVAR